MIRCSLIAFFLLSVSRQCPPNHGTWLNEMKTIVCIKQILDPEIPARDFRIDPSKRVAIQGSANLVTNIFCDNALEMALQLREKSGGSISVLTLGPPTAEDSLRKAIAMKADAAYHVRDDIDAVRDPLSVAAILARAIRKIGEFDIVMTGRESGDWGTGQTGALIAEELGIPCVSFVDHIEANDTMLQVRRQTDSGFERFELRPPVVLTITNDEHNVPRIPKTRDVMMSYRQPLTQFTLAEIGAGESGSSDYYEVADLAIPEKESTCEFAAGDTLEEKVKRFADRIAQVAQSI